MAHQHRGTVAFNKEAFNLKIYCSKFLRFEYLGNVEVMSRYYVFCHQNCPHTSFCSHVVGDILEFTDNSISYYTKHLHYASHVDTDHYEEKYRKMQMMVHRVCKFGEQVNMKKCKASLRLQRSSVEVFGTTDTVVKQTNFKLQLKKNQAIVIPPMEILMAQ